MSKGKGIGFLLGAIGGAVAGILLAPKSGKETRADIKDKAVEVNDKA
jgi:gas vesicle protein